MLDLRLVPHPSLSEEQQNLIAAGMFPGAHAKRLRVRQCLAMCVLQDLRVALDLKRDLPPNFQLALVSPASTSIYGPHPEVIDDEQDAEWPAIQATPRRLVPILNPRLRTNMWDRNEESQCLSGGKG